MNTRMILRTLGQILQIFAALLLLPLGVSLLYRESPLPLLIPLSGAALVGLLFSLLRPKTTAIYARDGFVIVGLGWILISLLGALPFSLSGALPTYVDALFESVSGLSTTGATVATDLAAMPRGVMFWRLFSHWIGGMGVLVFLMAVLPMSGPGRGARAHQGQAGAPRSADRPCALYHLYRPHPAGGHLPALRRHGLL